MNYGIYGYIALLCFLVPTFDFCLDLTFQTRTLLIFLGIGLIFALLSIHCKLNDIWQNIEDLNNNDKV